MAADPYREAALRAALTRSRPVQEGMDRSIVSSNAVMENIGQDPGRHFAQVVRLVCPRATLRVA
jgi:hypothetical protein